MTVDPTYYPAYYNERIETMPRAELEVFQEARLMGMLAFAYERSPLIRETWDAAGLHPRDVKSLKDFREKSPFIDKDAMRRFRDQHNDPCAGLMAVRSDELRGISSTSGTTGDPTPTLRGYRTPQEAGFMRDFWQLGMRPGDVIASLGMTFRQGHHGPSAAETGFTYLLLNHDPAELPRLFEASKRFRPTALFFLSNPMIGAIEQLLEKTGEDPRDIFASYKGVCFGGEPLGERQAQLTQSWGLGKLFEYGSLGDITGAMQCRAHDGLHAWEDYALVECLNPDGNEPVAEGEVGELVVTALADRYLPLIRYRSDDLVTMTTQTCSCGRTHARFWPIGRKGDQLMVAGRTLLPRQIQNVVEASHECRAGLFQIVRPNAEMDYLRVRVGYEEARLERPLDALKSELVDALTARYDLRTEVELVLDRELLRLGPPHKIPRVTKQ